MRKKVNWLIAAGLVFLQMQLCANYYHECSSSCYEYDCESPAEWKVCGEYLYWTTRKCDLDFVLTETLTAVSAGNLALSSGGRVQGVDPSYDSGFRLGLSRACNCIDIGVRYTYFRSDASDEFGNPAVDSVLSTRYTLFDPVAVASGKYAVDLDIVELECGYTWRRWCRTNLRGYGGFRYTRLDESFFNRTVSNSGSIILWDTKSDLDAYGIYLGIEGDYSVCNFGGCGSFGLMANIGLGAQYGHNSSSVVFGTPTFVASNYKQSSDAWIGNVDLAVGAFLFRGLDFLCGDWDFAIGYEFHTYLDKPPLPRQGSGASLFPACNAVSFDGLVVRAVYGFCW